MKLALIGIILLFTSICSYAETIAFHHCEANAKAGRLTVFAPDNEGYFPDVEGEFIVERKNKHLRVTANLREIHREKRIFFSLKPRRSTMGPSRWFKPEFVDHSRRTTNGAHRITQSLLGLKTGSIVERFEISPTEIYFRQELSKSFQWIRCQRK